MQSTLHNFLLRDARAQFENESKSTPALSLEALSPSPSGSGSSILTPSSTLVGTPEADDNLSKPRRSTRLGSLLPVSATAAKNKKRKKDDITQLKLTVDEEPGGKRVKLAAKMNHTIVINKRKVAIDAARRRWIYRHKELFAPLLSESHSFLDKLENDVRNSMDKGVYIPMHQYDEQSALVIGGQMKDYQLQGLSYLVYMYRNGMNCILGDEMGLGKTLQTLSLFAQIKEDISEPHLIVCPLSVLSSWDSECKRWVPSFKIFQFHGQGTERARLKSMFASTSYDICITTYEQYVSEANWFKAHKWTYVVLDEGHRIKNWETEVARSLHGIGSQYRLILTGTPLQNNMVELWGLLHFLYPMVFTPPTLRRFKDAFDMSGGSYVTTFLNAAKRLLDVVMLRRTKASLEKGNWNVPPREEITMWMPMSEAQRFWYYRLLGRMGDQELRQIFNDSGASTDAEEKDANVERSHLVREYIESRVEESKTGDNRWSKLMNLLMQLRKVCDHPYLLPNAEPEPYSVGEHIVAASTKLSFLDKLLQDILPKGERVLVFSQWTSMLDVLEDFMELRNIRYARLDGSTPRPRRTLDIKLFQQEDSPYQVFLVSTKAGGLGINLTKATTVVMFDSEWNPQNDLQAIARAHRIGQTKVVKVYRLIIQGSVEDQMLDRLRRKLFLSVKLMGADSTSTTTSSENEGNSALGYSELMDILRKGSSALASGDEESIAPSSFMTLSDFLRAPLDEILRISREREEIRTTKAKKDVGSEFASTSEKDSEQLLREAEEEEKRLLSGVAQVRSRFFEGRIVNKVSQNNREIAAQWREVQRSAKAAATDINLADDEKALVVVDGREIQASLIGPEAEREPNHRHIEHVAPKKRQKQKWEHEDWCIQCRDGGELAMCSHCPRVFHAACYGLTKKEVERASFLNCGQHTCVGCKRTCSNAGGMLFRCQTCPQAFCEECLPIDEVETVGDVLPEFLLLGYGARASAYYVRCHDYLQLFREKPSIWASWQEEMKETQEKLARWEDQE